VSLIHRNRTIGAQSDQTDAQRYSNMILEEAIRRSVMEAAQQGLKASSILAEKIPTIAAELERVVTDPASSLEDKLRSSEILAKILSRTVALENGLRRRAVANAEDRGRKARLELRKAEREEKKLKRQAKIDAQLAEAKRELEESQ